MKKIILASTSPRRAALLHQLGLEFTVVPSSFDERTEHNPDARQMVIQSSLLKAQQAKVDGEAIVVAADTVVVLNGVAMGKPRDRQAARTMLEALAGNKHTAITGFTILDTATGRIHTDAIATDVFMKSMTLDEIQDYVESGEPMDKAGAYAIQGKGAVWISRIEGDYNAVVGLPLCALAGALKSFGVDINRSIETAIQNKDDIAGEKPDWRPRGDLNP